MKISFFRTGKPKDFTYRPLYYDEQKEELENVRKKMEDNSHKDVVERIRMNLHRSWRERHEKRRGKGSVTGTRMLVYLVAIALLIYFIFFVKIF